MNKKIKNILANLKTVTEAEAKEIQQRKYSEKCFEQWNAPHRHAYQPILDHEGEWAKKFESIKVKLGNGFTIGICGGRGSGKTQMAVELMRESIYQGRAARYTSAISFFMEIKATYRKGSTETEESVVKKYTSHPFLVIDEFSKRGESEWMNSLLFEMIDRRYAASTTLHKRDTLLCDNLEKADFITALGASLASRLQETGGIIEANWKSYRA